MFYATIRALLIVALSSALVNMACGGDGEETVVSTPLRIGQLSPFTGDIAVWGAAQRNAAALAADHVNLAGGILGTIVTISARDTESNPEVAVNAARALLDVEGVVAIVGASSSGILGTGGRRACRDTIW